MPGPIVLHGATGCIGGPTALAILASGARRGALPPRCPISSPPACRKIFTGRTVARLTRMLCAKTPDVPASSAIRRDSGQRGRSGRDADHPGLRLRQ
jgi:hypothetical protein